LQGLAHYRAGGEAGGESGARHVAIDPENGGMEITYDVVVEKVPKGFSAFVPDLPGCTGHGATEAEAFESIRTSVTLYLDVIRENGEPIPQPTPHAFGKVTVGS
jgi:predicted RNase H-like HicB family nuclease